MSDGTNPKLARVRHQMDSMLQDCGLSEPQGLRLLEVGFKDGLFLQMCRGAGIRATGLEVVESYYQRVGREDPDLDLILYDGAAIPLADASFDVIVSFQVLEHVGSVETTLSECVRLLKPGGVMYHVVPNYHSFYEGHYKVFWWPFLNKAGGRRYLKLLRKYTPYYESLNLVKPDTVRRLLAAHGDRLEVLSLGKEAFKKRFTPEQIRKVDQRLLRGLLRGIQAVPLLRQAILGVMSACDIYYPITIIARKYR